ncbi:serine protease-like protein [Emericellopsis cladophorae]|uniref:Serine protease-like protein n=1 Tax=Emericellopsis cladophorae TaxID=2686198 RepID=A0A9P9XYI2_9HYPO|nr:serine protease-like protein [Emericellopsis cladophorae]KAI6779948.1 serine protease-like protein [Emericellopsis cladophorae]
MRAIVAALVFPAVYALQGLPIPFSKLAQQSSSSARLLSRAAVDASYPEYNLSVPIDHFHNDSRYEPHSDGTFNLRYWFDAQYYKPGGPVFVLGAGETSGEGRLPFLQKGIVHQVAKATNGIGIILEHRYYGSSVPTPDFETESLRFLTTEQALADTAYFAKNVQFEGLEDVDFSPDKVPWIAYGGSYAGAFVAFLRIVYPDIFFAAISSSGVPAAIWDYWEYYEAARLFGPGECGETQGKLINVVDNILMNKENAEYVDSLKQLFGMGHVRNDADFAASVAGDIAALQSYNWDPAISTDAFFRYCETISSSENMYPDLEEERATVEELLKATGYEEQLDPLVDRMLNFVGYQRPSNAAAAARSKDDYETTSDESFYVQADLSQTWRLWPYQVCTEWGFLQTGSGVPDDILPMVSRLVDLEYSTEICRSAFNISEPADTDRINKFGGFDASYPRLAWLDGEWDPWRAAGVHALSQDRRESTPSEPLILIDDAVHHWDENGVFCNETRPGVPPRAVKDAQRAIRSFVKAWLEEW